MSRELTIGEADAWRAGRDAALNRLHAMAAFMRRHNAPDSAALYEVAAEAIAKLRPGADTPPPAGWNEGSNVR